METVDHSRKVLCHHCDHVITLNELAPGHQSRCPHCNTLLQQSHHNIHHLIAAIGLATLVFLIIALTFPFLTMQVYGNYQSFSLFEASTILLGYEHYLFSALFTITIIVMPASLALSYIVLYSMPVNKQWTATKRWLLRFVARGHLWVMADIFLVAVLISMVKVMAMADVTFEHGFWAFCLFVVSSLFVMARCDQHYLWRLHVGQQAPVLPDTVSRGIDAELSHCQRCGAVNNDPVCHCCGKVARVRHPRGVQHVMAWALTSLIFYFPANSLPIMYTSQLGAVEASSILEGVFVLWAMASYPVAIVIFFASIVLPLIKILALLFLCYVVRYQKNTLTSDAFNVYRAIEFFGKWSMIDVYVIAVLVALVQIQGFAEISPGEGVIYFAAMVITAMFGANAFDPRHLWDKKA